MTRRRPLVAVLACLALTACATRYPREIQGGSVLFYSAEGCQISVPESGGCHGTEAQFYVMTELLAGDVSQALRLTRDMQALPPFFEVRARGRHLFALGQPESFLTTGEICLETDLETGTIRQVPCELDTVGLGVTERFFKLTAPRRAAIVSALREAPGTALEIRSRDGSLFFALPVEVLDFLEDWRGTCARLKAGAEPI